MTTIVRAVIRDDDEVAEADGDLLLTSGTQVGLDGLIRLDSHHRHPVVRVGIHDDYSARQLAASIRHAQSMPTSPGDVTESCVSPTNV